MKFLKSINKTIYLIILFTAVFSTVLYGFDKKETGYLGVSINDLTKSEMHLSGISHGVMVKDVIEGSPAEKAGIQEWDVIQFVNNIKIEDRDDLVDIIRETEPDKKIDISLIRDGKSKKISVKIGAHKRRRGYIYSFMDGDVDVMVKGSGFMGVHLRNLNNDLAGYFGIKEDEGVLILSVEEDSPAQDAGIKSGDIIIKIGDEEVKDTEDVVKEISDHEEGDKVKVTVIRHEIKKEFEVELKKGPVFLSEFIMRDGKFPKKHIKIHIDENFPEIIREDIDWHMENFKDEVKQLKIRTHGMQDRMRKKLKIIKEEIITI